MQNKIILNDVMISITRQPTICNGRIYPKHIFGNAIKELKLQISKKLRKEKLERILKER